MPLGLRLSDGQAGNNVPFSTLENLQRDLCRVKVAFKGGGGTC